MRSRYTAVRKSNLIYSLSTPIGRTLSGIEGSNTAGAHRGLSVVIVVCFYVEVPATGRIFVQRSPSEWGVSECDLETSTRKRRRPSKCWRAINKNLSVKQTNPVPNHTLVLIVVMNCVLLIACVSRCIDCKQKFKWNTYRAVQNNFEYNTRTDLNKHRRKFSRS